MATLQAAVDDLAVAEAKADAQLRELERFLRRASNWWRVFLSAAPVDQKTILRQVVDHVTLSREGYTIFYRVNVGADVAAIEWREAAGWSATRR